MDLQDIEKKLKDKFTEDYPEFYDRRIVVWTDPEEEFMELIDEINIDNVKTIKMGNNNKFQVKKTICFDDKTSDYLVYCPLMFENPEDNWITDVFRYSEEFRADRISIEISEMQLDDTVTIRKIIKAYKKFFNAKSRRDSIKKLSGRITSPSLLIVGILSSISKCEMDASTIIREVIKSGLDNDTNPIYQDFIKYEIDNVFWKICEQHFGYISEEPSIKELFNTLLLTASSRKIDKKAFVGLEKYIITAMENNCFQFIEDWIVDLRDSDSFIELSKKVEEEFDLFNRLKFLNISEFEDSQAYLCIDEAILTSLMTNIQNDIIDPEELTRAIENRRVTIWFKHFENYYEAIYYMAKIKEFYNNNQASFHEIDPATLWNLYTDKFYLMDTYYRKFQRAFQKSLINSNSRLDDLLKSVVKRAEGIYKHWFLDDLLTNWCNIAGRDLEEFGHIQGVEQQKDFYLHNIKPAKSRTFVIISDAMRYEVGVELKDELRKDMQCTVDMKNMEGVFPTVTSFGMAALLPNKGLETEIKNDTLKVLIDGEYTDSIYREKILKKTNEKSVVLKYDDFIQMNRTEKKDCIKGMDVVYIYHDKIDASSHHNDKEVFTACNEAIIELKSLIRLIVNELSGINIMITSDHGFIYTYEPFTEEDKVTKVGFDGTVEYGRRYAIMKEDADPSYLMPVKFVDDKKELKGFAPRENTRIKKQGGGINFVHGGISLQEKVVPLIVYRHLRNDNKEYLSNKENIDKKRVELKIQSTTRKISNMRFRLSFYQNEMVRGNVQAGRYSLYFVDEAFNIVSDKVVIIADKNNPNDDTDRQFNEEFNLRQGKYTGKEEYYLIIFDELDNKIKDKIEFNINIPLSIDGFDFFN